MKKLTTILILMAISWIAKSQNDDAIILNGIDNYVEVLDNPTLDLTDTISVEAWLKPYDSVEHVAIIGKQWCFGAQSSWRLSGFNGKLRWHWNANGNCNFTNVYESDSVYLYSGECVHVAAVHTPSEVKLFVNGILVPGYISLDGGGYSSIHSGTADMRIGAYKDISGNYVTHFNGEIDEVRLWNYALTESEISNRMFSPLTGQESGLIAYYNMEVMGVGSGLTLPNISAIGTINDGTTFGSSTSPAFGSSCWLSTKLYPSILSKSIRVYPNPTNDIINIDKKNLINTQIEIFDCTGKLIYSGFDNNQLSSINLSEYSNGIYFIKLSNNDGFVTQKIIKN